MSDVLEFRKDSGFNGEPNTAATAIGRGRPLLLRRVRPADGIITAETKYPVFRHYTTQQEISDLGGTAPPHSIVTQPSAMIFDTTMIIAGDTCCWHGCTDAVGHAHGDRAADHVAHNSRAAWRPAEHRAGRTRRHQGSKHDNNRDRDPRRLRHQRDGQQRQHRPGHERQQARPGGMAGTSQLLRIDAQLSLGVCGQRVAGGQPFGNMPGQAGAADPWTHRSGPVPPPPSAGTRRARGAPAQASPARSHAGCSPTHILPRPSPEARVTSFLNSALNPSR